MCYTITVKQKTQRLFDEFSYIYIYIYIYTIYILIDDKYTSLLALDLKPFRS